MRWLIDELGEWLWEWLCVLTPLFVGWFIATKVKPKKTAAIIIAITGALVVCLVFIFKLPSPASLGAGFTGFAMLFTGIYFSRYADIKD